MMAFSLHGQTKAYCGVKTLDGFNQAAAANSDNYDFYDRFGNKYSATQLVKSTGLSTCQTGYFELEFFGEAFTDDERTTICDVFSYVSTLFTSNNTNIPIRINKSLALSNGDAIADASPFYRNALDQIRCGVNRPIIWDLINTSFNQAEELPSNYPYFVGEIRVNSVYDFYAVQQTESDNLIGSDAYDLYSIILHEIGHLLGFASNISSTGESISNNGYTNYDLLLYHQEESTFYPLIVNDENGDCCDAVKYNPDLNTPETQGFYGGCESTVGQYVGTESDAIIAVNIGVSGTDDLVAISHYSHLD